MRAIRTCLSSYALSAAAVSVGSGGAYWALILLAAGFCAEAYLDSRTAALGSAGSLAYQAVV